MGVVAGRDGLGGEREAEGRRVILDEFGEEGWLGLVLVTKLVRAGWGYFRKRLEASLNPKKYGLTPLQTQNQPPPPRKPRLHYVGAPDVRGHTINTFWGFLLQGEWLLLTPLGDQ